MSFIMYVLFVKEHQFSKKSSKKRLTQPLVNFTFNSMCKRIGKILQRTVLNCFQMIFKSKSSFDVRVGQFHISICLQAARIHELKSMEGKKGPFMVVMGKQILLNRTKLIITFKLFYLIFYNCFKPILSQNDCTDSAMITSQCIDHFRTLIWM